MKNKGFSGETRAKSSVFRLFSHQNPLMLLESLS